MSARENLPSQSNLRSIDFTADYPDQALMDAVRWMREDDSHGRTNLFYFLDLMLHYDSELGWTVTIYAGAQRDYDVGKPRKRNARSSGKAVTK